MITPLLPCKPPERKNGLEAFHTAGIPAGFLVQDFWRWSASDLLSNATRGVVAEFLVARALGISTEGVRNEWQSFDLETSDGIGIEVKSAAYLQSWAQRKLSEICFVVPKTHAWNPESDEISVKAIRQADVYVFAMLITKDKNIVDPLDLAQWEFYILSTSDLNNRTRSQHSITLKTLKSIARGPLTYSELAETFRVVASGFSGAEEVIVPPAPIAPVPKGGKQTRL